MTQEQEIIVEEYMAKNDNGQEAMNAMWLAEEMWEQHCAIMQAKKVRVKLSGSLRSNMYKFEFGTYMMAFSMALMEYIWLPHDIIKAITADLDDAGTMPEEIICTHRDFSDDYMVRISYMGTTDKDHDYEQRLTFKMCNTKTEAEALTAILNHANQAGHDAVTRLSA
jgi:hypothetical protein